MMIKKTLTILAASCMMYSCTTKTEMLIDIVYPFEKCLVQGNIIFVFRKNRSQFDRQLGHAFQLFVDKQEDLAGLPEWFCQSAAEEAKAAGQPGKWLFTLHVISIFSHGFV